MTVSHGMPSAEWLEADGLGGFASGTVGLARTRRYHALLHVATRPPAGRMVLVGAAEVEALTPGGAFALSSHRYAPGVTHPDGVRRVRAFRSAPWPTWTFELEDGTRITQEVLAVHGQPAVLVRWRVESAPGRTQLVVRPLFAGRDFHALHRENAGFDFAARPARGGVRVAAYPGVPAVRLFAAADFEPRPDWYRQFLLDEEARRGLDAVEDLACVGALRFDLASGSADLVLAAELPGLDEGALAPGEVVAREEARRRALGHPLRRAADAYVVRRGGGATIIAGYPWFGDWGRDTLVSLRGLCLATGRLETSAAILREWSGLVSEGMLPNRFADDGGEAEYNSVDAALWHVTAVREHLAASAAAGRRVDAGERAALEGSVAAILAGHARGTRAGIRVDDDGLLAAGEPGVQLTWMDARVRGRVVTPRIGKPVEVQALWLNALDFGRELDARWEEPFRRGALSFERRFWNAERGCLFDVVDADHVPGRVDAAVRPNQLWAVGGLPLALVAGERARRIVDACESLLWTPLGPRTLEPDDPAHVPCYEGGPEQRDAAYHQGAAWPWLAGAFVLAWLAVRGNAPGARLEARRRFLAPLREHLLEAGLGHVSELADSAPPHVPRGCPFQAWSLGELLRVEAAVAGTQPEGDAQA